MTFNSKLRREATFQDLLPRESSTSRQASLVELRYAKGMSARCSMCCSVLQCVAGCYSVLQCVASENQAILAKRCLRNCSMQKACQCVACVLKRVAVCDRLLLQGIRQFSPSVACGAAIWKRHVSVLQCALQCVAACSRQALLVKLRYENGMSVRCSVYRSVCCSVCCSVLQCVAECH